MLSKDASRTLRLASFPARACVVAAFWCNGVAVGSIGALMPLFATRWGTDSRGLGLFLFAAGCAAILGINIAGRVADRVGALRPTLLGMAAAAVGLLALAAAPTLPIAVAVILVYGLGNGLTDTAMNVLAVGVEGARGHSSMSRFHACWSVGSFTGAALVIGVGAIASGTTVAVAVLVIAAVLNAVCVPLVAHWSADTSPVSHHDADGVRRAVPRAAYVLAAMAIGFGLAEGTAFDWSSVHVRDVAKISSSQAAWGLAVVSICMVVVRMCGDHLVERVGRRMVVRCGAATAVLGYLLAVTVQPLGLLLLGWALVGAGMALVAPQIYGLAGMLGGGRGLSLVVTFGYATSLIGPGAMGLLVHRAGVQTAMLLPLVAACVVAALSLVMPTGADCQPGM
ncbi:MFS transporter [Calidifontibacter terrae]